MKLLIDGDLLVYRISSAVENTAFNYQGKIYTSKIAANRRAGEDKDKILKLSNPEPLPIVHKTIQSFLDDNIFDYLPFHDYKIYLSSKGNFRDKIATILGYKKNREGFEKPYHFENVRDFLLNSYDSQLSHPLIETDDELSLLQDGEGKTIIVSIDKDLLQLEGMHYNFLTHECSYISKEQGLRNFYKQVLIGDSSDNIPGIHGIGEKSVYVKRLEEMNTEEEMFHSCLDLYNTHYRNYGEKFLKENILLLYLLRDKKAYWKDYFGVEEDYWKK